MRYHAAEICTTAGYHLVLHTDAAVLDKIITFLESLEEIETHAVGIVQASGRLPKNWSSCYVSPPDLGQGGTHEQATDRRPNQTPFA